MSKKRVFVIDDEEEFCKVVKSYLEASDKFEVGMLTDSRESVNAVKTFKPDIILLDLRMPHVGGFEVCELLNKDEDTRRIPIILVTSVSDDSDVKKAFHSGVSAYIAKPVELKQLAYDIEEIISD